MITFCIIVLQVALLFYYVNLAIKYKKYEYLYFDQLKKDILSDLQYATTEEIFNEIKKRPIHAILINVEFVKGEPNADLTLDSINLSRKEVAEFLKFSFNLMK